MSQVRPTDQHANPPSDETLQQFAWGLLDDDAAQKVSDYLATNPDALQRVEAFGSDRFLQIVRQSGGSGETHANIQVASDTTRPDTQPVNSAAEPPSSADTAPAPILNLHPELARLEQYRILRQIGAGGMSVVYLAENLTMGREEVLKVLNDAQLREPGARQRFEREIKVAAKLNHPNIVTAYNAIPLDSLWVLAMEYVRGNDLEQHVRVKGPLPIAAACAITRQVAAGLQYALDRKVIHRDIKPANLILKRLGTKDIVKILDFGLAKAQLESGSSRAGLTSTGTGMGTPHFMAPEQMKSAATVDIRADIYSLGCTLYYLIVGRPPYEGTVLEVYTAHSSTQAPPLLSAIRGGVSAELDAIVGKMMAKSPSQRFETPQEVFDALAPFTKKGAAVRATPAEPMIMAEAISPPGSAPLLPTHLEIQSPPAADKPQPQPRAADPSRPVSPAVSAPVSAAHLMATQLEIQARPTAEKPEPKPKTGPLGQIWRLPVTPAIATVAGIALLLLGYLAWQSLTVRTQNGTIVFQQLPADADVFVDGDSVFVEWDSNRERASVRIPPGERYVEVKRDGLKVQGSTVTVSSGETKDLVVRVGEAKPTPSTPQATLVEMVPIPAGEFQMGNEESVESLLKAFPYAKREWMEDAAKQHLVKITRPFQLGKFEVTVGQFRQFVEGSGYQTEAEHNDAGSYVLDASSKQVMLQKGVNWRNPGFEPPEKQSDRHPVVNVSWNDAIAFCNWLSVREGRSTYYRIIGDEVTIAGGNGYRLPTEAEWEYACRAGSRTRYQHGDDPEGLARVGNVADANFNAKFPGFIAINASDQYVFTAPVGQFDRNNFGLYDMHGNVWEWCWDRYDAGYYDKSPTVDPAGPDLGSPRVNRGGGWNGNAADCRAAIRNRDVPSNRSNNLGFRLALSSGE